MDSLALHVAITYKLGRDNPIKFQLGTPREVARAVSRCWEVEPTDERLLDDIESWEFALDKIIAARGTVVHGLAPKHGHRAQKKSGKGECKTRVSNRQRKETLFAQPVHIDAQDSFNIMAGIMADTEDRTILIEEIERAEQNELQLMPEAFEDTEIVDHDEEEE